MVDQKLSHIDPSGRVKMVDVGDKLESVRYAIAKGEVKMVLQTYEALRQGNLKKGDALAAAQIAGIMAAKKTSDLIPLCHPLIIDEISVDCDFEPDLPGICITARVRTTGKTGAEMEALTAVSVAALTVYDMAKAIEKTMRIQNIRLVEKHGGKSGDIINE